jgi:hypothetical protein
MNAPRRQGAKSPRRKVAKAPRRQAMRGSPPGPRRITVNAKLREGFLIMKVNYSEENRNDAFLGIAIRPSVSPFLCA